MHNAKFKAKKEVIRLDNLLFSQKCRGMLN